ncbi:hypothetical protein [Rhodococcus sp. SGAir0479]|uniref:hypothetical protein n=1 Tax=Rhodococcus sp. SGAir0479 TaxID=2567884 RepID=UPI0010CCBF0F|nr:hypothetical protein [Rhodococcus sp. SGAir0479]QCQ93243.1 hypothetical protein E7742_19820 [Rhodococcus sp. SGAir0479]
MPRGGEPLKQVKAAHRDVEIFDFAQELASGTGPLGAKGRSYRALGRKAASGMVSKIAEGG